MIRPHGSRPGRSRVNPSVRASRHGAGTVVVLFALLAALLATYFGPAVVYAAAGRVPPSDLLRLLDAAGTALTVLFGTALGVYLADARRR